MEITPRSQWGAKKPLKRVVTDTLPWPRVWLHHTVTSMGGASVMRSVQRDHQGRRWRDFAYNIAVGSDGIYEGIGIGVRHLNSDAGRSGTIVLLGNFDVQPVPDDMLERTAWLVAHGLLAGWWLDAAHDEPHLAGGHKDVPGAPATACPGRFAHASIPAINARAAEIIRDLSSTPEDDEEDDMTTTFAQDRFTGWWACCGVDRIQVSKEVVDSWAFIIGLSGKQAQVFPTGEFADLIISGTTEVVRYDKVREMMQLELHPAPPG